MQNRVSNNRHPTYDDFVEVDFTDGKSKKGKSKTVSSKSTRNISFTNAIDETRISKSRVSQNSIHSGPSPKTIPEKDQQIQSPKPLDFLPSIEDLTNLQTLILDNNQIYRVETLLQRLQNNNKSLKNLDLNDNPALGYFQNRDITMFVELVTFKSAIRRLQTCWKKRKLRKKFRRVISEYREFSANQKPAKGKKGKKGKKR